MSAKVKAGRPRVPAEQKAKPNPTLQVRLTGEQKAAYAERMGRENFIELLELPDGDWQDVLEILARHHDGEFRNG